MNFKKSSENNAFPKPFIYRHFGFSFLLFFSWFCSRSGYQIENQDLYKHKSWFLSFSPLLIIPYKTIRFAVRFVTFWVVVRKKLEGEKLRIAVRFVMNWFEKCITEFKTKNGVANTTICLYWQEIEVRSCHVSYTTGEENYYVKNVVYIYY